VGLYLHAPSCGVEAKGSTLYLLLLVGSGSCPVVGFGWVLLRDAKLLSSICRKIQCILLNEIILTESR
jgi:hypothetical protein